MYIKGEIGRELPTVPGTSIRLCGYSLLILPFIHHPLSVCLDLPPNCAPIPSSASGPALPSIASTVPHLTPAAQLRPYILSPWQQHFHNGVWVLHISPTETFSHLSFPASDSQDSLKLFKLCFSLFNHFSYSASDTRMLYLWCDRESVV